MIKKKLQQFSNLIENKFEFDVRAFSLFRIALGLIIVLDLAIRATDLTAFYTEDGILPFGTLSSNFNSHFHIPVYELNDSFSFVLFLFIVQFLAALLLILGRWVKISQVVLLLFYISLDLRNPFIAQGGDDLLRVLIFWSLFLPMDQFYCFKKKNNFQIKYLGFPAFAFLLQIVFVYFFSALLKSSSEWHSDATALYYAFSIDQIQLKPAKYLLQFPDLLQSFTHLAYYIELLIPLLFIVPFKNNTMRMLAISILLIFHLFITATLFVGLFSIISCIAFIPFISTKWMDKFDSIFNNPYTFKNEPIQANFSSTILALIFLFFVLGINHKNLSQKKIGLHREIVNSSYFFGINQNWGMFAPDVYKDDGWYVYEAITNEEDTIDIFRQGEPVSFKKPANVLLEIKNDRWRKFAEQLTQSNNSWIQQYFCDYLFENWNANNPTIQIKSLRLIYMLEKTPAFGKVAEVKKVVLWDYKPRK